MELRHPHVRDAHGPGTITSSACFRLCLCELTYLRSSFSALQPPFYSQNLNIMYQQILNATLTFPSDVTLSAEAKSLLEGVRLQYHIGTVIWFSLPLTRVLLFTHDQLLTRDPTKRLGSEDKMASDIRRHPFFKHIDWDQLYRKEIEAPFKPKVNSVLDLTWIDPIFKEENVRFTHRTRHDTTHTARHDTHWRRVYPLVPAADHGADGEALVAVVVEDVGEDLGGGGDGHALLVAQLVESRPPAELALPVGTIGGTAGHGAQKEGVDPDHLLHRLRGCVPRVEDGSAARRERERNEEEEESKR